MPSTISDKERSFRSQLDASLRGGKKLSQAGAQALIAQAKQGKLTESEAHVLRGWAAQHRDRFDASARATLDRFISRSLPRLVVPEPELGQAPAPGAHPQPGLAEGDSGGRYSAVTGSLVKDGFGADDPSQGGLGDCYLISALASLAQTRPQVLQDAVKANPDGTFTVTFHEYADPKQPGRPVQVTVDGQLPQRAGRNLYVSDTSQGELWPQIIEKAYATWKGGYEQIQGGYPGDALAALTGEQPRILTVNPGSRPGDVFKKIKALCDARKAVTCYTTANAGPDLRAAGVAEDHAYTILGTAVQNGKQYIQLRNPWGSGDSGGIHGDIFILPVEQFVKCYEFVDYVD